MTRRSSNEGRLKRPPRLKIVAGPATVNAKQLRAGGLEPDDSMSPGEYIAHCEGATITTKGRSTVVVLEFRILDGPHSGTALRQWVTVPDVDGNVTCGSRYGRQCALALGREIEPGEELHPAAVFKGKNFRVAVGYRMTEKIGGTSSAENAEQRKDAKDFLRVHALLSVEESL
jgi:hypothetical protein